MRTSNQKTVNSNRVSSGFFSRMSPQHIALKQGGGSGGILANNLQGNPDVFVNGGSNSGSVSGGGGAGPGGGSGVSNGSPSSGSSGGSF